MKIPVSFLLTHTHTHTNIYVYSFIQSGPNAMNWDLIGISSDEDDDGA
jgi:hypothetical protein